MNAKVEFLHHTGKKEIKCAEVEYLANWTDSGPTLVAQLPIGYSDEDLEEFLNKLDFKYSSSFGNQYLHGTIWYTDGTWSERFNCDGSECGWLFRSCPSIPDSLQKTGMKTGKEWLSTLHPVEQRNWEENVKLNEFFTPKRIEFLHTKHYYNLREFLMCSFIWDETPQGKEYWDLLSQK